MNRLKMKDLEAHLDLDQLIQESCRALLELTKAQRCSIMVLDGETEELAVRWAQGIRVKPYGRMRFRVGEGLCGWAARLQRPFFSFDPAKEVRYLPSAMSNGDRRRLKPVRNLCCLPLVTEGRTVGVINLSTFGESRRFREAVKRRLSPGFLDRLAKIIAQAMLLKEAEAASGRWRRLTKGLSEMVRQVGHEVRAPLSLIKEAAQQTLEGLGEKVSSPRQRENLELIKRQADRTLKLVGDLLDLSRIEAGRLILHRHPMNPAELIREVVAEYAPLISPRRLHLKFESEPLIYGDRIRLTQVLENLLTNAVKFTPPEGAITFALRPRGNSVQMEVTDTGVGISQREQRRLFERFFQTRIPARLGSRGTGLGLAIVKDLVQLHGGTLRVASAPGKGTTFTVSFPLYTPAFALTEEFRVMREQAAREGSALGLLTLTSPPEGPEQRQAVHFLEQEISRQDRVLINPAGAGGLVVLALLDPKGFKAFARRLIGLARSAPSPLKGMALRWGWALVPQEET
ncbi:MAG: GAF domain-containing sensor histidine kinase [Candidatus Omnitrophica bacterium]|nr:GAF domain-containing sensor histidine kinase [Candidatus Omnitrophota bacterium]